VTAYYSEGFARGSGKKAVDEESRVWRKLERGEVLQSLAEDARKKQVRPVFTSNPP